MCSYIFAIVSYEFQWQNKHISVLFEAHILSCSLQHHKSLLRGTYLQANCNSKNVLQKSILRSSSSYLSKREHFKGSDLMTQHFFCLLRFCHILTAFNLITKTKQALLLLYPDTLSFQFLCNVFPSLHTY